MNHLKELKIIVTMYDIESYLKSLSDTRKTIHISICDYCKHALFIPGRAFYCSKHKDLIFTKGNCEDINISKRVEEDDMLICPVCDKGIFTRIPYSNYYRVKCSLGIEPRKCTGKNFKIRK